MAIKRTKWDVVFSNYIRYRDDWTCQRCNKKYPEKSQGLHCSHFYGRRSWATRIEPCNAMALCFGCHQHVGSFPKDHVELWESKFTEEEKDSSLDDVAREAFCKLEKGEKEITDLIHQFL